LKDASATAIYGVRGANGVVIINTKKGESGKLSITARANFSLSILKRLPEYLRAHDYALLANEAREVRGDSRLYSDLEMDIIRRGLDPDIYPDVDWQSELIKPVSTKQNYFVSARGGGSIARYYVSLGGSAESAAYNVDKSSIYASNVGYNTYNYRTNLDISLTKTTTIFFSTDGFLSVRNRPGMDNTDDLWKAQSQINPLMFPVRYSTGQLPAGAGSTVLTSPYVQINNFGRGTTQEYRGKATLAVNQDLAFVTEGLKISVQGAYDLISGFKEDRSVRPALYRALGRNYKGELIMSETGKAQAATYDKSTDQYRKYYLKSTLNWQRSFAEHRLSALVNYEISDQKRASTGTTNMNSIPVRYQSVASWLTYSFRDTYMLDANFGYTGSENFEPGRQYGFFPSIGLGWALTGYQWVKDNVQWLNFLKIRATYGAVGNDRLAGDRRFPYMTLLTTGTSGVFGGGNVESVNETWTGADNLMWEKASKANIGIEGRLFKDKLTFTVDFFHDQRDNIFQQREQVPGYVGLINKPFGNVGKMKSYGTDGNAEYTHDINRNTSFVIRGNFSYSRNLIQNFEEVYQKYPYQEKAGYPNGVLRGFQSLGFFKDENDIIYSPAQTWNTVMPGDIKYKDVNSDGKISDADMVPLSYSTYPLLMYGFTAEFHYKNLTVGAFFRGTGETPYYQVMESEGYGYIPFRNGEDGNVLSIVNDPHNRWIPRSYALAHGIDPTLAENPDAKFPRLQYGDNPNNRQMSDFWKGDARYLRLQEVTINYNLRRPFMQKIGLQSVDLQLVGTNLYVWDKVKLFDPEQAKYNGRAYPIPMTFSFQIYINI
jgi:TonB-linked SusC/RagA family outer membrane protein